MAIRARTLHVRLEDLDGPTKSAILLLALDQKAAGKVLERLPAPMIEAVKRELASLGDVPSHVRAQVLAEFHQLAQAGKNGDDGVTPSRPESPTIAPDAGGVGASFSFLHKAEIEHLLTFIQDEHPQTIALILGYLPNHRASAILGGLPALKQVEVVRRMAVLERARPDVIHEVEEALEQQLTGILGPASARVGGIATVAEVLNLCDRGTERTIMDGLGADDPELVDDIRRLMFVFEDLLTVNDRGIQAMLKEIDHDELALALKTASEALREKIFANMSARACDLIHEEMEYMGPVRVNEVEAAQQRIVDVVRRLEDSGELIISGRSGRGEIVV